MKGSSVIDKIINKYSDAFVPVHTAGIVKRLQLSSPQLNYIFGGGFPIGKIVEFFGKESGGKTIIASYIASEFQKKNEKPTVVYIDMEYAFNKQYSERVGLNTEQNFIFIRPKNGEEAFSIMEELAEVPDIGLMVLDSVAATPTSAAIEADYGKQNFGSTARLFSEGLRKLNPVLSRNNISLILTNQVRDEIGGFSTIPGYKPTSTPGGRAIKFYSSWRGQVSPMEDIVVNKEVVGNIIKIKNVKSKICYPKRTAILELYYDTGFDTNKEYLNFIINLGLVKKKGSWFVNEDLNIKVQGKEELLNWLVINMDVFNSMKEKINSYFEGNSFIQNENTLDDPFIQNNSDSGISDEEE